MADPEREYDLSRFEEFSDAVAAIHPATTRAGGLQAVLRNGYYCVRCGDKRRMRILRIHWEHDLSVVAVAAPPDPPFDRPALFSMMCVQCGLIHTAVVHEGPNGFELAVFSTERGGFSTPNTPPSVSYYLDQAHRAESVGALSAAAAMYRSALEMLLYDQGYETGMLNRKIEDLLADEKPPRWRDQIDPDYLGALKQIGNGAMHPNDGDIARQQVLDRDLLGALRAVFEELLDWIYERPAVDAARKARLTSASESFRAPAIPTTPATTSTAQGQNKGSS